MDECVDQCVSGPVPEWIGEWGMGRQIGELISVGISEGTHCLLCGQRVEKLM